MQTDRELLELAAKSINGFYNEKTDAISFDGFDALKYNFANWIPWNPLNNSGNALDLAIKLGIGISFGVQDARVVASGMDSIYGEWEKIDGDPFAATRRAIVRAAAEIGKEMK